MAFRGVQVAPSPFDTRHLGGDQGSYDTADNVFGIIFQLGDSLLYWLVQVLPLNGNAEFRPVEVLFRWISRCNV